MKEVDGGKILPVLGVSVAANAKIIAKIILEDITLNYFVKAGWLPLWRLPRSPYKHHLDHFGKMRGI